jgi:hypothetical protein
MYHIRALRNIHTFAVNQQFRTDKIHKYLIICDKPYFISVRLFLYYISVSLIQCFILLLSKSLRIDLGCTNSMSIETLTLIQREDKLHDTLKQSAAQTETHTSDNVFPV